MATRIQHYFLFSLLLCVQLALEEGQVEDKLLGFLPETSKRQLALEQQFDSLLNGRNLRVWMQRMTAKPHHLGSPFGKEVVEFIASQFNSWGYETQIEKFDVLFPTPKLRLLEMTGPEKVVASLDEPILEEDSTSKVTENRLPPYNAYSIDGEASGQLVYVNYGLPKDYEYLDSKGIDVKGKVVLARYG